MEGNPQLNNRELWKLENCKYTSCYCEENVYLLCKDFLEKQKTHSFGDNLKHEAFAVFVTNKEKKAELRQQKAGQGRYYNTVIWDYHVIFIHKLIEETPEKKVGSLVYDLDTTLRFPEEFERYYKEVFDFPREPGAEIFFRVVDAKSLIENFCSDRSHMVMGMKKVQKKFVKVYHAEPPTYPEIVNAKGEKMNLPEYWNLDNKDPAFGIILSQPEFFKYFTTS